MKQNIFKTIIYVLLTVEPSLIHKLSKYRITIQFVLAFYSMIFSLEVMAQGCPYNIDFETGTFNGWTCLAGIVRSSNSTNVDSLLPLPGPIKSVHDLYTANTGDGFDRFGYFPVNCPNGSGHSIKLGNDIIRPPHPDSGEVSPVGRAEAVSYEFTVPANQNEFTLTYNYALVLHKSARHREFEQSRFEVQLMDMADSTYLPCGFFSFNANNTSLPGFIQSENNLDGEGGSLGTVWYKNWTSVTVNMSGQAGRRFKLFFKVAGCTKGAHFAYAYIDVNSACTNAVLGSTFCPKDSVLKVEAPYGYNNYTWYDSTLSKVLGKGPVLTLKPPPPSSTKIAVAIEPDLYYGCPQNVFIRLMDTLKVSANAGIDTVFCGSPIRIGDPPKYGFVYKWKPATGLSDPNISNPLATPATTTNYVLTVTPLGGGQCIATDTVQVRIGSIDNSLDAIGGSVICSGGSAVLRVKPIDNIQWYKDDNLIPGANQTDYVVKISGVYYAALSNKQGCATITKRLGVYAIPSTPPTASFSLTENTNQCLAGNQFSLINTSINTGNVQYKWLMGDGKEFTTKDVTYTYSKAGTYNVYLLSDNSACTSSSMLTVVVYQNALADFTVDTVCINVPATIVNTTVDTGRSPINYSWKFSNGQVSNLRNPPQQVYNAAGSHPISLSVSNTQCPAPLHTITHNIVVENPLPAISYPLQYAAPNFPVTLHARQIGNSFLWRPAASLNQQTTPNPVFNSTSDQFYTVEIRTAKGCITVDTQKVSIVKNLDIYVPSAFTPNNDGKNDILKPITYGLPQVRSFKVFNRLGQILFESKDNNRGWDGIFKGKMQQTQTVVWVLEAAGADGKTYYRSGTSNLVR